MTLLRSNDLRILLAEPALTDLSDSLRDLDNSSTSINWVSATSSLFIGFRHKFNHRYFKVGAQIATLSQVTFTDAGDLVGLTAHGRANGDIVSFTVINTTTGLLADSNYFIVNASTDSFQVSATLGGSALPLTTDGTGTMSFTPVQSEQAMTAQYWNGSAWTPFLDLIDETNGFNQSGFVVWEEAPTWRKSVSSLVTGITGYAHSPELFWVKVTLGTDPAARILLDAVLFLLSDDREIESIYPEIMRYLPVGATSFLPQHILARNLIVGRLKVESRISYQEQIKNPDDWMLAASYKCVEVILDPISGDERLIAMKKAIAAKATEQLSVAFASIDTDKSESLDDLENPDSDLKGSGTASGWFTR